MSEYVKRVERRLPINAYLRGKVYSRFTLEQRHELYRYNTEDNANQYTLIDTIANFQNRYVNFIEFIYKKISNLQEGNYQPIRSLIMASGALTIETTDSYFNRECKMWECVIAVDDLVEINSKLFIVNNINTKSKNLDTQNFYYIELLAIL